MDSNTEHQPSAQVQSLRSAFALLSEDDKYDAVETFLNDLGIVAWHDNSTPNYPLLCSLIRMESARMITKSVVERMNQLITVFAKQSLGSSYDSGVSSGKLFIYSPTTLPEHMNNKKNRGLTMILVDILDCLRRFTPLKIHIIGVIDGKREDINMSHLVHHYSEDIAKLTAFGYDLSRVLPGDD